MITEKSFMFKDAESIFCGSFLTFRWSVTFYDLHNCLGTSCFFFFSIFQELRTFKNYRASRFKFPDKKLISLRRFTISTVECRWFIKICSFSFFRIRSAIAQQITSHLREYWTSFRVFIRLELDVQLYLHVPTVWAKSTKFSSVPTKIMAMDVPI